MMTDDSEYIYRSSLDCCSLLRSCVKVDRDESTTIGLISLAFDVENIASFVSPIDTRFSSNQIMTCWSYLFIQLSTYFLSTSHLWRYPAVYLAPIHIICFHSHYVSSPFFPFFLSLSLASWIWPIVVNTLQREILSSSPSASSFA